MNVGFELKMSMTLYHSQTMKELKIDKVIKQEYNEESKEYKQMCEDYTEIVGFNREENEDKFDKILLNELVEQAKNVEQETIETIEEVVKNCYYKGATAFITFGGYFINPKDFCAIRLNGFNVEVYKN